MPNYPYCGDWNLEPPDTTMEELAAEKAMEDAWDELLTDGALPNGDDAGTLLDAYVADDQGEMLDLLQAYHLGDHDAMLAAAEKIATRLEAIAEEMIDAS